MGLLFCALRGSKAQDCRHRRGTHPKNFGVRILDFDPDGKSLSKAHPVKCLLYEWNPFDVGVTLLGLYRGRNSLDDSLKTSVGIRQEINFGSHTGTYVL